MSPRPTLATLLADLAAGRTTSRELVESALAAIAADPRAFTAVHADAARAAADAADRARVAGRPAGALAGIPVSIKELFDEAGHVTEAGSPLLRGQPAATRDSAAVARLRGAGAIVVGRTQMSELAFSGVGLNPHRPQPVNPCDPSCAPGGSSSGAAVSVAQGAAAVALGTDTGGSTRIPAALCGLVGFKPTQARVDRSGAFPLSTTLDSIGPIGVSVDCCARVDAVIADAPPALLPPVPPTSLRMAMVRTCFLDALEPPVADAYDRALRRLRDAGIGVDEIDLPALARIPAINARGTFSAAEAHANLRRLGLWSRATGIDANIRVRIEPGATMSAADYLDLVHARAALIAECDAALAPWDVVVVPTVPILAPRLADLADPAGFARINGLLLRNPSIVNLLDRCAISLPLATGQARPAGLMLVGEHGDDARLFAIARTVEAVLADTRD